MSYVLRQSSFDPCAGRRAHEVPPYLRRDLRGQGRASFDRLSVDSDGFDADIKCMMRSEEDVGWSGY